MRIGMLSLKLTLGLLSSFALAPCVTQANSTGPIKNLGSDLCLQPEPRFFDPSNFNVNGLPVVQAPCNGSPEQTWEFRFAGRHVDKTRGTLDFFTIVNRASPNMCLDLTDGNITNGTPMQQWTCGSSTTMRWMPYPRFSPGGPAPHRQLMSLRALQGAGRFKCLDIRGGSLQTGAQLQIYDCSAVFSNYAQEFLFNNP
jgi:hypothetical protein